MYASLNDLFTCHCSSFSLESNKPVILDHADVGLYLVAGKAEVFVQQFMGGEPQSARMHLYTAEPGDLLLSAPPTDDGLRLLAVGGLDSEIVLLDKQHLELAREHHTIFIEFLAAVDRFLVGLGSGLIRDIFPKPRLTTTIVPSRPLVMSYDTIASPRYGVAWVSGVEGSPPLFLGQMDLPSGKEVSSGKQAKSYFPLPEGCWISSTGPATLSFVENPEEIALCVLLGSVYQWAGMVLECAEFNSRMALVDTLNTIRNKQIADVQYATVSAYRLASVLAPTQQRMAFSSEGSALYKIMCQVGASSDIRFRQPVRISGSGITKHMDTVPEIANLSGVRYRRVELDNYWWKREHGPLVAFTKPEKAPVAVVCNAKGNFVVTDAEGGNRPLNAEVAGELADYGYIFHKSMPFTFANIKGLIGFVAIGLGKDVRTILLAGGAVGLLGLLLPLASKTIFNSIIPASNPKQLSVILLGITAAIVATACLRLVGGMATLRMEAKTEAQLETVVWDRLLRMPLSFFSKYSSGSLAGRCLAFQRIRETLSVGSLIDLTAGVFSLANLMLIFILDLRLGVATAGLICIQGLVNWFLTIYRLGAMRSATKIRSRIDGIILQLISGLHQIRAFGVENRAFSRWASLYSQQRILQYKAYQTRNFARCFNGGFIVFSMMIVFAVVGFGENKLDSGTFIAFFVAFGLLQSGILKTIGALSQLIAILPQLERLHPILANLPEDDTSKLDPVFLGGKIDFCEVSFSYEKDAPQALDKVSFTVHPGEFLAIAGPSGSGKSTVLRLLAGLDSPDTGSICFDDRELSELDARLVRRRMGVVLQDFGILPGTVRQAIAGDHFPSEEEIWNAVEISQLTQDIQEMAQGLDTVLSRNGTNLSGGQRQKLMLARAIIHNPSILIMDESTSALDNDTQAKVIARLEKLQSTRIVVAHRLSTIKNADRILIFDQGRIVESGDFLSLMQQKGMFYSMASRQIT